MESAAAKPHKFYKGSARMFRSDFFEWFSHVHPATPAVLYLPLVAFALYSALAKHALPPGSVALWFGLGYVLWTLFEYWFHRLFFHLKVRGPRTERLYFFVHGVHHDYPWDTTRLVMPPSVSLTLAVVMYFLFRAIWGATGMWAPFGGFVFGYVVYDSVHWYTHAGKPRTAFGKWLRREHLVHHFKDSGTRFGVSCPWLDYLFGTQGKPQEAVAVPSREATG